MSYELGQEKADTCQFTGKRYVKLCVWNGQCIRAIGTHQDTANNDLSWCVLASQWKFN